MLRFQYSHDDGGRTDGRMVMKQQLHLCLQTFMFHTDSLQVLPEIFYFTCAAQTSD